MGEGWLSPIRCSPATQPSPWQPGVCTSHFSSQVLVPNYRSYFILWSQPQMFNKANLSPVVIREMALVPPLTSNLPHTQRLPQATDLCGQCPRSHSPGHIAGAWCWGQPLLGTTLNTGRRKEKNLFLSLEKHFGVWPEACPPNLQNLLLLCF